MLRRQMHIRLSQCRGICRLRTEDRKLHTEDRKRRMERLRIYKLLTDLRNRPMAPLIWAARDTLT
jgi:hypothetical protein